MTRLLLLVVLILPQFAHAGDFYIGINIGNRMGGIIGYRVDNEHSVEAHFGGVPHPYFGVGVLYGEAK